MRLKVEGIFLLVAPWLLAASLPAAAAGIDKWDGGNCLTGPALQNSCTETVTANGGGPTLTWSAISDTDSNSGTTGGPRTLAGAYVGNSSPNLGVTSKAGLNTQATPCSAITQEECQTPPQDFMDNDGNSEFMLLSFASAVTLTDVQLGAHNAGLADSDLTILAYTFGGTPTLNGRSYSGLASGMQGWQLIGNYADVWDTASTPTGFGIQTHTVKINPGNVSSSYWLIGAYNNSFGTLISGGVGSALTFGNDYVKLLAVYGQQGVIAAVPEPSSVLLICIALIGFTMLRKRGVFSGGFQVARL